MVSITAEDGAQKGSHIEGSPFIINCSSNRISAGHSRAQGAGLDAEVVAGSTSSFTIVAMDEYGNAVGAGGDEFEVILIEVGGLLKVPCLVHDAGDGSYVVRYSPRRAGVYAFSARVCCAQLWLERKGEWEALAALGEKNVAVVAGPTSASCSFCRGTVLDAKGGATQFDRKQFEIVAQDRYENRVGAGGDPFRVRVSAGWAVPSELVDNGDGTYLVSYSAGTEKEFSGSTNYEISVTLDGEHVLGSPFVRVVRSLRTDPAACFLRGAPDVLTAGEPFEFGVQVKIMNAWAFPRHHNRCVCDPLR